MSIIMIRAAVLYVIVVFSVRLMGKRQLGELQPSELVITILVSNIATLPLEDTSIPVIQGITPILSLVCFEVLVSWLILRFPAMRKIISGSPKIIVKGGKVDREVLRELRFSVDDLMTALRGHDIFDISEVQYAVVETTGSVSVMKKSGSDTPVREDMGITVRNADPPQVIVSDGVINDAALKMLGLNRKFVENTAKSVGVKLPDIFIMTADDSGKCYIAEKSGKRPIMTERSEDK